MNIKSPDRDRPSAGVGPRTPTEKKLAEIWSEILGIYEIGANDNFVHLGGDSISATLVLNRVADVFKLELSFEALFDDETSLGRLAGVIDDLAPDKSSDGPLIKKKHDC